ncbi:MAG: ComF family protein [Francisella sp.]
MKIITKISKILLQQSCIICKQSANDTICNYCFDNLIKQLNLHKQNTDIFSFNYFYLLKYSDDVKLLLQKFKFNKDLLVTNIFAKVIKLWWDKIAEHHFADVDAIAVVPIHRFRYVYRGFNQSEILANVLSKYTGIKTTFSNYKRIKYTKPQSKSSKHKRITQIKGVFKLTTPIVAKHLIVFDDVLTTGATLNEFIKTIIKGSQIEKISVITLVRPE